MAKILNQDEIDALLGSSGTATGARPAKGSDTAVRYDFRRPDRASREQIRSLHLLHDRFARDLGTSLSAYLRTVTEVGIVSVEQFTYAEFLMALPDPTAYYAMSLQPMDGVGGTRAQSVDRVHDDRPDARRQRPAGQRGPRPHRDRTDRRRRAWSS